MEAAVISSILNMGLCLGLGSKPSLFDDANKKQMRRLRQ